MAANANDDWELFCNAIPIAYSAALFWMGNDPEAVKARRKLFKAERGCDSYYAKICSDLQSLASSVDRFCGNGDASPTSDYVVEVLDMLNIRCKVLRKRDRLPIFQSSTTPTTKYDQLYKLVQYARSTSMEQTELVQKIRFQEERKEKRSEIIRRLTNCAKRLEGIAPAPPLKDGEIWASENWRKKEVHRLYSKNRRSLMTRLYQLLTKYWTCNCSPHSDVHVLMDPLGEPSAHTKTLLNPNRSALGQLDGQFTIWFRHGGPTEVVEWQESIVLVYSGEWSEATEIEYPVHSQSMNSKGKSISFAPEVHSLNGPWNLEQDGICKLIRDLAPRSTRNLHLLVKENDLKHWYPQKSSHETTGLKFWSLQEATRNRPSILGSQNSAARYVISFLVASSFLQICGSPWLVDWSQRQQISFLGTTSGRFIGGIGPYLSTTLRGGNSFSDPDDDTNKKTRQHPYPNILALGILLLQIWLGCPVRAESTNDSQGLNGSDNDIDAYILVAYEILQDNRKIDCLPDFNDAIKACVDPLRFIAGQSLEEEKFREEVYKAIVGPIEYIVRKAYRLTIENRTELRSFLGAQDMVPILTTDNSSCGHMTVGGDLYDENRMSSDNSTSALSSKSGTETTELGQLMDDWMKELEKNVNGLLERSLNEITFKNELLRNSEGVRVAILDTGINLSQSAKLKYKPRVKGYKDWVQGGREGEPWVDDKGHGTHAAGLLLKVAPKADIYVARVFEKTNDGGVKVVPKLIADAIMWAVDKWNVDIISMSFELEESNYMVEEAISYAHYKKVIMFAAAGNSGGNAHPPSPGKLDEVIAVHAADALGNPASFTANPRLNGCNFMLPGIDVNSTWARGLTKELNMRISGTSCSAPIAAALAANLLEIAGLQLFRRMEKETVDPQVVRWWVKLRSLSGICKAFSKMSVKRGVVYDYVQPQLFFGQYDIITAMNVLLVELK